MKTAILISGHMRSFDRCLPTQHWHIFRHFPGADFFVSTVEDDDAPKAELLRTKYPHSRVEIECVPGQPDCIADLRSRECSLPTEWTRGQPYTHEPYPISVHPQAVARQLWQLEQVWKLFVAQTGASIAAHDDGSESVSCGYARIIRCRPDLWIQSAVMIDDAPAPYQSMLPWWGRFGGINDRFAILGPCAAHYYFTTYRRIPLHLGAGCPLHPESLVAKSLEDAGSFCSPLAIEFATLRKTGELRAPEISGIDLAHVALNPTL